MLKSLAITWYTQSSQLFLDVNELVHPNTHTQSYIPVS
jgi:hypothetical protein